MRLKKNKLIGFSIVELMTVLSIVGIIVSLGIPRFSEYRKSVRDNIRHTNVGQFMKMFERYYDEHGVYPDTTSVGGGGVGSSPNIHWSNSGYGSWEVFRKRLDYHGVYLVPDPTNEGDGWARGGKSNYAIYSRGGHWYMIVYYLEQTEKAPGKSTGVTACGGRFYRYNTNKGGVTVGVNCKK